ncbi:hypothetical protein [Nonomuraea sp. NPDC050310]|uniref:hypothetical protein n=1 Tax=Nonomuraea sp. NPDC050310 TaxID=3154935 RepID=UPI00340EE30B
MPIDYFDEYFPVASKIASTAKAQGLDSLKDQMKDIITDYLDKKTPDTAEETAGRLVNLQAEALIRSLRANGQGLLTSSEDSLLRAAMAGRMTPALIGALKIGGG